MVNTKRSRGASVLRDQGDLAGARPLVEQVPRRPKPPGVITLDAVLRADPRPHTLVGELAFWKKILSLEHTNDLASEYRDRARSLLERLPPTSEFDRPYTATGLNAHACVLWDHGDLAGARPRFERALAISEKTRGPNHPDTATFLNNLAIVLRDQGDLAGARQRFERALAIWESGPNHPDTAAGLNNLAIMFRDQGDFADARERFERALDIWENTRGPDHPLIATFLNNLGAVLRDQGDLAGARPLVERALEILEKERRYHPDTAIGLNNLAVILRDQGDLAGARTLVDRALDIWENKRGSDHPDTATGLNNLAVIRLEAEGPLSRVRWEGGGHLKPLVKPNLDADNTGIVELPPDSGGATLRQKQSQFLQSLAELGFAAAGKLVAGVASPVDRAQFLEGMGEPARKEAATTQTTATPPKMSEADLAAFMEAAPAWPSEKWKGSPEYGSRKQGALFAFLRRVWKPFIEKTGAVVTRVMLAEIDPPAAAALKSALRAAPSMPPDIGIIATRELKNTATRGPKVFQHDMR